MRDTPILDFAVGCAYAVMFCALGIVKSHELYWIGFGAALVCCVVTLPPALRRIWTRATWLKLKIITQDAKGETSECQYCGRRTDCICKVTTIYGKHKHKMFLCATCYTKIMDSVLEIASKTRRR